MTQCFATSLDKFVTSNFNLIFRIVKVQCEWNRIAYTIQKPFEVSNICTPSKNRILRKASRDSATGPPRERLSSWKFGGGTGRTAWWALPDLIYRDAYITSSTPQLQHD